MMHNAYCINLVIYHEISLDFCGGTRSRTNTAFLTFTLSAVVLNSQAVTSLSLLSYLYCCYHQVLQFSLKVYSELAILKNLVKLLVFSLTLILEELWLMKRVVPKLFWFYCKYYVYWLSGLWLQFFSVVLCPKRIREKQFSDNSSK